MNIKICVLLTPLANSALRNKRDGQVRDFIVLDSIRPYSIQLTLNKQIVVITKNNIT